MDAIKALQDERFKIAHQIRDLQQAREANGKWEEGDAERFDSLVDHHAQLGEDIEAAKDAKRLEFNATITEDPEKPIGRSAVTGRAVTRMTHGEALRAWINPHEAQPGDIRSAEAVGLPWQKPFIEVDLFRNAPTCEDDIKREMSELEEEQRQQATTPGSAGGYTVPNAMLGPLERNLLHFARIRQIATVIRTARGNGIDIPTVSDVANKGVILAENSEVAEQSVAFGQVQLKPFKYSSKMVRVSVELMQDNAVNLPSLIGSLLGERIGRIQADHFTVGTGSGQPQGYVTGAGNSGVVLSSATAITTAQLTSIKYSLDTAYSPMANWTMSRAKIGQIAGMTTESGGNSPVWMPALARDIPATILGDPYLENPAMPTGASAKSITYGDHRKYHINDCTRIVLMRLNERYAEYHQVGFLAYQRSDGRYVSGGAPEAIIYASDPASV